MARFALVHDYLLVMRGAERTFAAIADLWPEAPIYTLLYDERGTDRRFADRVVRTSPLQPLHVRQRGFRALLPLYPAAVRALPLESYDCVISSSSAFAHGAVVPPDVPHVCYCHSPFRYAWYEDRRPVTLPAPLRPALELALRRHRSFDLRSVAGVDQYVANSQLTKDRIKRFWGRSAVVVHPPVDVDRFTIAEPEDYILHVGELVKHKRVELAIDAAVAAGRRTKIVGDGPELGPLRARYGHRIEFLGRVADEALSQLYARAAALVVPNVEEFGIAAVEAQAAGRPVVAIAAGGALETVVDGRTGTLVPPGDFAAFTRALAQDFTSFDPHDIRAHAKSFSPEVFGTRMREIVSAARRSTTRPTRWTPAAPRGSRRSRVGSISR
jgi:glycosyltransferase involved in cell wall biosynthesis